MGVFKSEDLTPVEWASHSARVWGEYRTPAGGPRHNFCFLLNPNAESTSLILFFCDMSIALFVNSHYGGERRHWQPNCHTRTRSCWGGLRFVPRMEVWHLWLKALKVGRLLEEFLILSGCRRTMTACHVAGWTRVRVSFDDAGKQCLALINS